MLKYEKILHTLTLEKKVTLITSEIEVSNRTVENFELPIFGVTEGNEGLSTGAMIAPRYQDLASTWNPKLVEKAACEIAKAHATRKLKNLIAVSNEKLSLENRIGFSEDDTLNAILSSAFSTGVYEHGFTTVLVGFPVLDITKESVRIQDLTKYETVLKNSKCFATESVLGSNARILDEWKYRGLRITISDKKQDLVRSVYEGNHISIARGMNAVEIILAAIEEYKKEADRYNRHEITRAQFQELERTGMILSEEKIDLVADSMLDYLSEIDTRLHQKPEPQDFYNTMYEVAKESIILFKNKDNVLPLSRKDSVTIFGEYAKNTFYNTKRELDSESPMDLFEDTEIKVLGYAHGYLNDGEEDAPLLDKAKHLAVTGKIALVYVGTKEDKLPKNQLMLLEELFNVGVKVIAVVTASQAIDMNFERYCTAVVLTGPAYSGSLKALCDILVGDVNPSGHLPYQIQASGKTYPVGYGLSYTEFEYRSFKMDKQGLTYTVENIGAQDGYSLLNFYVGDISGAYTMKATNKIWVRSHESIRVYIPFDEYTFRYYDEAKQCYGVRSGDYLVYCGRFENDVIFESVIDLDASIDNPDGFTYTAEEYKDDFKNTSARENYIKDHTKMGLGKKLTIFLFISIYYYGMLGLFLYFNLTNYQSFPLYIALAVLAGGYTIFFIIFLILAIKHRQKKPALSENDELTTMLGKMDSYNVIAHESYLTPVEPEKIPLNEQEEIIPELGETVETLNPAEEVAEAEEDMEEEEALEEEIPSTEEEEIETVEEEVSLPEPQEDVLDYTDSDDEYYDESKDVIEERQYVYDAFGNTVKDKTKYSDSILLGDIASDFCKYTLGHGIVVEPESARTLFAALAASHLILLRTSSNHLSIRLVELLENYLGNDISFFISEITSDIEMFHDLIWAVDEDGNYIPTKFLEFLLNIKGLPNHINIMAFTNVEITSFSHYFRPFIRYSAAPLDEHRLDLQIEGMDYVLPKNLYGIIVPSDPNYMEELPNVLLGSSVSVTINLHEADADLPHTPNLLSYPHFNELVRTGKDEYYIDEELWKKLDDFEEELSAFDPSFKIGNKKTLAIEKMASVLLASQADLDETVDTIFAANIVPVLKKTKVYQNAKGDQAVLDIINKIFGSDVMPKTVRSLKKPEAPVEIEEMNLNSEEQEIDDALEAIKTVRKDKFEEESVEDALAAIPEVEETIVEEIPSEESIPLEDSPVTEEIEAEEESSISEETEAEDPSVEEETEEVLMEEVPGDVLEVGEDSDENE